ncbi:hypothetical protein EYF80_017703 [Liparis tanakae]|uniref:Uncharacterized protein n=1 Tax=Liparis tanakae TaxID=230148 RepID=A0A4Z2I221_9TELE|nr:hypothetical protein EYF80_017703 [Liparis tanakae]
MSVSFEEHCDVDRRQLTASQRGPLESRGRRKSKTHRLLVFYTRAHTHVESRRCSRGERNEENESFSTSQSPLCSSATSLPSPRWEKPNPPPALGWWFA